MLPEGDTVGAAAWDSAGHSAAATSTGGILGKRAGRVGDAPVAGAGTYARDDLGAISGTGHGETFLRTVLAFQALLDLSARREGEGGPEACLAASLEAARARVGGRGGLIAVLPGGRTAWARNTPHMGVAWIGEDGRTGSTF